MKARIIPTEKPSALLYGLGGGSLLEKLTAFFSENDIAVKPIQSVTQTLEAVINSEAVAENSTSGDFPPCIILSAVEGKRLQNILNSLQKIDENREALKAVVTPTNRSWTVEKLLAELQKEHEQMNNKA